MVLKLAVLGPYCLDMFRPGADQKFQIRKNPFYCPPHLKFGIPPLTPNWFEKSRVVTTSFPGSLSLPPLLTPGSGKMRNSGKKVGVISLYLLECKYSPLVWVLHKSMVPLPHWGIPAGLSCWDQFQKILILNIHSALKELNSMVYNVYCRDAEYQHAVLFSAFYIFQKPSPG